jgi:hypothetical protein
MPNKNINIKAISAFRFKKNIGREAQLLTINKFIKENE